MAHGRKRKNAILRNKDTVNMLGLLSAMNYMSMDLLMVAMAHAIVDIKYIHTMFDIKHRSHIEHTISQNRFNICLIWWICSILSTYMF